MPAIMSCTDPAFRFGAAGGTLVVLFVVAGLVSLAVLAAGVVADVRDWWRSRP